MRWLTIASVDAGSALAQLGLQAGDRLLAIDGLVPRDAIDVLLELSTASAIVVEREGERMELRPEMTLEAASLSFEEAIPGGIRECNNHCEFCFIRGLPNGLRQSLYVFDDDYRYSFLWGNFLTLTNLDAGDWARIGYQRLSPLNVSVHATNDAVRRQLLNKRHAPEILPQLRALESDGIEVNAQVVLCAGINDGCTLDETIADLSALYPCVRSLSVVPVGLTRYSRVKNIRRPTPQEAARTVEQLERWHSTLRERLGVGFVYPSDELYVLSERHELPSAAFYDGFPVLSNGVGLLRSMLDEWQRLLERQFKLPAEREVAWLTGRLAAPALNVMADLWRHKTGWRPEVVVVDNTLFGDEVTVSGLLSGHDLVRTLNTLSPALRDIVLPRGPFGFDGRTTLDGVSIESVGDAHAARVHLAANANELLEVLIDYS